MEFLIAAFQRITPWYQDPDYEIVQNFPHGLPLEDVENWLGALPFQVPQEVYELYQWCNGSVNPAAMGQIIHQQTDLYFYNIDYMAKARVIPLRRAIDLWFDKNDEDEITDTWYQFPIFSYENGLIVIAGSDRKQESSPVWDVDCLNDELRKPVFPNLTSLMTGIADTVEAEREFWDELGYFNQQGYCDAYKSIWKRYRA